MSDVSTNNAIRDLRHRVQDLEAREAQLKDELEKLEAATTRELVKLAQTLADLNTKVHLLTQLLAQEQPIPEGRMRRLRA
jgi:prefoldin subunit 5